MTLALTEATNIYFMANKNVGLRKVHSRSRRGDALRPVNKDSVKGGHKIGVDVRAEGGLSSDDICVALKDTNDVTTFDGHANHNVTVFSLGGIDCV